MGQATAGTRLQDEDCTASKSEVPPEARSEAGVTAVQTHHRLLGSALSADHPPPEGCAHGLEATQAHAIQLGHDLRLQQLGGEPRQGAQSGHGGALPGLAGGVLHARGGLTC